MSHCSDYQSATAQFPELASLRNFQGIVMPPSPPRPVPRPNALSPRPVPPPSHSVRPRSSEHELIDQKGINRMLAENRLSGASGLPLRSISSTWRPQSFLSSPSTSSPFTFRTLEEEKKMLPEEKKMPVERKLLTPDERKRSIETYLNSSYQVPFSIRRIPPSFGCDFIISYPMNGSEPRPLDTNIQEKIYTYCPPPVPVVVPVAPVSVPAVVPAVVPVAPVSAPAVVPVAHVSALSDANENNCARYTDNLLIPLYEIKEVVIPSSIESKEAYIATRKDYIEQKAREMCELFEKYQFIEYIPEDEKDLMYPNEEYIVIDGFYRQKIPNGWVISPFDGWINGKPVLLEKNDIMAFCIRYYEGEILNRDFETQRFSDFSTITGEDFSPELSYFAMMSYYLPTLTLPNIKFFNVVPILGWLESGHNTDPNSRINISYLKPRLQERKSLMDFKIMEGDRSIQFFSYGYKQSRERQTHYKCLYEVSVSCNEKFCDHVFRPSTLNSLHLSIPYGTDWKTYMRENNISDGWSIQALEYQYPNSFSFRLCHKKGSEYKESSFIDIFGFKCVELTPVRIRLIENTAKLIAVSNITTTSKCRDITANIVYNPVACLSSQLKNSRYQTMPYPNVNSMNTTSSIDANFSLENWEKCIRHYDFIAEEKRADELANINDRDLTISNFVSLGNSVRNAVFDIEICKVGAFRMIKKQLINWSSSSLKYVPRFEEFNI